MINPDNKIVNFTWTGNTLVLLTETGEVAWSVDRHISTYLNMQAELLHHLSLILQSMALRKAMDEEKTKMAIERGLH